MNILKRILYLGYYFKQLDWQLMSKFLDFAAKQQNVSKIRLWISAMYSTLRYNISLLEYFQFRFFELKSEDRIQWAGTGFMYEFQRRMNPPDARKILDNKVLFAQKYKALIRHQVFGIEEMINDKKNAEKLLRNTTGNLVLKVAAGKCGKGVEIRNANEFSADTLIEFMQKQGYDLAEEFIVQHIDMSALSPSAVNTVRIFTQLDNNYQVHILGCRLRISINSPVDNLAAGNAAAPIDERSGIVSGPAVFSDITKADIDIHPITHTPIVGFQIPFWNETMEMAHKAALMHPENKSIGWDIAITPDGPDLIEGNHDWCKLLWQLPVKKGLKPMLENF
jgi:hypothetical protein